MFLSFAHDGPFLSNGWWFIEFSTSSHHLLIKYDLPLHCCLLDKQLMAFPTRTLRVIPMSFRISISSTATGSVAFTGRLQTGVREITATIAKQQRHLVQTRITVSPHLINR
jgi:hypothetical protein